MATFFIFFWTLISGKSPASTTLQNAGKALHQTPCLHGNSKRMEWRKEKANAKGTGKNQRSCENFDFKKVGHSRGPLEQSYYWGAVWLIDNPFEKNVDKHIYIYIWCTYSVTNIDFYARWIRGLGFCWILLFLALSLLVERPDSAAQPWSTHFQEFYTICPSWR